MSTHTTRTGAVFKRDYLLAGSMRFSLTGRFALVQAHPSALPETVAEYASPMQSAELWMDVNDQQHPVDNTRNAWNENV